MLQTFKTAYALKNTYRVNGIIYSIKQIPLLGRVLPDALYRVRVFKVLGNILSGIWEFVSAFLGKFLYVLLMVTAMGELYDKAPQWQVFLHIFFLLTFVGAQMNTYLFDPTNDKYYAISLMRMNARNYMLSWYLYSMLRVIVGFLPFTVLLGRMRGVPLWICLILPLFVAGGKLMKVWLGLNRYERTGKNPDENKMNKWGWIFVAIMLAAAYGLPWLGIVIPWQVMVAVMTAAIAGGLLSVKKVVKFAFYRELCQQMLADKRSGMDPKVTSQRIVEEASRKKISTDASITSRKKGLEYFNELFIKRHRRILWNSAKRVTVGALAVVAVGAVACMVNTKIASEINQGLMRMLPVFLFLMYILNRGTTFTQALFINCDHSMLTYGFYKKPATILKLFWIRLRELIKINLVPAAVIGLGLSLLLYLSGGTDTPVNYVVLTVSVMAMSIFFSVHYLMLYYLLQPYNAQTELKSGTYKLMAWVTYLFCYVLMQVRMSSLVFGGVMIAFSAIYCIVAGILVYKLAGKTFRIRN